MKLGSKPLSRRVVSEIVIINFEINYFWSTADVDDDVDDETTVMGMKGTYYFSLDVVYLDDK